MPESNQCVVKRTKKGRSGITKCCPCPCESTEIEENQQIQNNQALTVEVSPTETESHVEDLPRNLDSGTCIHLEGFIKPQCSRFAVNLTCGRQPNSDIAVHINPRLSQRYVVRNTRLNGRWGDEEATSVAKFELSRNKKFVMDIFISENAFYVSINGKHICAFVFRIPISKVKVLQVEGAIEVYGVEYRKLQNYPPPSPLNEPFIVPTGADHHDKVTFQQLDTPVTAVLPEGFQQGWQLEIYGRVKILPSAFYINLQKGTNLWPHPIVHLHINPRFSLAHGKHLFITNAWLDGQWGQEERSEGFQFSPGSPFSIAIRRDEEHFSIWVDGQLAGEFKFRGNIDKIDSLYIHGDVVLKSLYVRQHVDDKFFRKENLEIVTL